MVAFLRIVSCYMLFIVASPGEDTCRFDDSGMKTFNFGLLFNEFNFELKVGGESEIGILDSRIDFMQVEIEGLGSKVKASPHYVAGEKGFHDHEIPGHRFTKNGYFRTLHAEYTFSPTGIKLPSIAIGRSARLLW
ncbi:hypothetical protein Ciccas_013406 [Cichlidogyrus casuarinus]|uniref:Uncharacterized protein n=1 Tax=Cichlidogyrus casuarinus TaxID=1844966 RepID=A0ABD2PN04_9PLAT